MTRNDVLILAGVGVVALMVAGNKAKATAAAVGQAVNPVSRDNIFNRGFHAVYGIFTDGKGTLGTDIYDVLH